MRINKINPNRMSLNLAESLKIFESASEAKKILDDAGIDSQEQEKFFDSFSGVPEYLDKFAEWLIDEENDLDDIQDVYDELQELKDLDINIDRGLESFPNLEEFVGYLVKIKRRGLRKSQIDTKEDTPKEKAQSHPPIVRNQIEDINQDIENSTDRDTELIPSEKAEETKNESEINTKNLNKNGSFQCLTEIYNTDALNIRGQGLYIWTQESLLKNKDLRLKFGQYGSHGSPKLPQETVMNYEGATIDPIIFLYAIKLDDYFKKPNKHGFKTPHDVENYIRKSLHKKGGYTVKDKGTSKEIVGGMELDKLILFINEVLFDAHKLKNYSMRDEQKDAHDKMVGWYKDGGEEFLLAAKMRFGKNFTLLNVAKTMNFKNILVLTYKPHVFPSLKDDLANHVNFDGWKVTDFKEQRKLLASNDKPAVFMSSAQLAQYKESKAEDDENYELEKTSIEDLKKNLQQLKKIHWDFIIADEYHYGTSTINFQEMLKELNYSHICYVSGTAMKDIEMGRFTDDEIYEWSYIDEQRQKDIEKAGKSESKQHVSMPSMEMHLMDVDPTIVTELMNQYDEIEGFTMSKMIGTDSKGKLKHPQLLKRLLEQISGEAVHHNMSPYTTQGIIGNLDHTLWVLDKNVKGITQMAEIMKDMPQYADYDIIPATGNIVTSIDEVKERINRSHKTITLTCYRFKEGTSVPEWNGVFMLDSGKSIEEYLQAIFRCQTPNPEADKDKCYVFDFSPIRALNMTYEICENTDKKGDKKVTETIREYLDYAPILDHRNNKLEKVDFNEIIENFRAHGSFSERFANIKNIDMEKIDDEVIDSVIGIKVGKRGKRVEVNYNEIELGKNFLPTGKKGKGGKKPKTKVKEILEKIATVLSNIPEFMFDTPGEESTVDDILNTENKDLFRDITGITIEEFKMWVDKGVINKQLMNRNILNYLDAERKLMDEASLENLDKFAKKNFNLQGEESSTPSSIVNEMLDKLPDDVWKDPNKKFCDPCCGSGKFLIGVKDRLMEGLASEIPDEEEREKHIIEEQLYGFDSDESKTIMSERLINSKGYDDNIYTEDSLNFNWDNMPKFDVVVGNPPYQQGLHMKFLELAYDISKKYIIFIQPANWLISKEDTSPYRIIKNKVKNEVSEITIFNGNFAFNVALQVPFSITLIDKLKDKEGALVIDKMNNRKVNLKDISDINRWADYETFPVLKEKILELASEDNCWDTSSRVNPDGDYFVGFPRVRGHVDMKKPNNILKEDFFTIFPQEDNITKEKYGPFDYLPDNWENDPNPRMKRNWYGFQTLEEANNFMDFLKTRWGMFALSIYKIHFAFGTKEVASIPWLDWSQSWPEEKFEKLINATPEEIAFVKENIPDYYGIAKED